MNYLISAVRRRYPLLGWPILYVHKSLGISPTVSPGMRNGLTLLGERWRGREKFARREVRDNTFDIEKKRIIIR